MTESNQDKSQGQGGLVRVPRVFDVPLVSRDSGPGLRWLLFLQGCRQPCTTTCLNPHLLNPSAGHTMSVHNLLVIARQAAVGTWGSVEGITLLGGEPSDQATELLPLLREIRELGLSVMLYSGHKIDWFCLPENRDAGRMLDFADIVVDGPFIPELANPELKWRGSENQRVIRMTDRYSPEDLRAAMGKRGVTLRLHSDRTVTISGLQDRNYAKEVEQLIRGNRQSGL